jgi:dihydrofolate reductase
MGHLSVSALVTVDGVTSDPPKWIDGHVDDDFSRDALERIQPAGALLMGRVTYEFFSQMWPNMTGPYPDKINSMKKVVFSSTLRSAEWKNSTIVRGDVVAEVRKLKEQVAGDLAIYGYGKLSQTLMKHGLIDELHLSIFPVMAGEGSMLFSEMAKLPLDLIASKTFSNGIVALRYRPATA